MKLLHWLEDQLDKKTPKIEFSGYSMKSFSPEEFHTLMNQVIQGLELNLRSRSDSEYILVHTGTTFGQFSPKEVVQRKDFVGNAAKRMKSKIKCSLTEDGQIEILSYEHILGTPKELRSFKESLSERMEQLIEFINNN